MSYDLTEADINFIFELYDMGYEVPEILKILDEKKGK